MHSIPKFLLIAAFLTAIGAGARQATHAPFSVEISTPTNTVKAGTEVKIKITVTNTSNHRIYLGRANGLDQGECNNTLYIWKKDGKPAPEKDYGKRLKGEPVTQSQPHALQWGEISYAIDPGKSLQDAIIVNKQYDLSEPGKYTIQVNRYDISYSKEVVKSNKITLTVTP